MDPTGVAWILSATLHLQHPAMWMHSVSSLASPLRFIPICLVPLKRIWICIQNSMRPISISKIIRNPKKSIHSPIFFEYPIKFNSHHIPIFTTISPCSLWKIHQILNPSSVSGVESAQPWWLVGLRCHWSTAQVDCSQWGSWGRWGCCGPAFFDLMGVEVGILGKHFWNQK